MPLSHIKERLSVAYVIAVAARAGVCFNPTEGPEYGVDGHLRKVSLLNNGKYAPTGHILSCQLKATTTCQLDDDFVVYDMDVEDYNKLARWEGSSPCILVLLRLPEDFGDWVDLNEERLLLRKCCYWAHITDPPSGNRRSHRLRIPRAQRFTPKAVQDLLERIKRGQL